MGLSRFHIWMIVALGGFPLTTAAQIAVRGETVYTMSGPAIQDGVIIIHDGVIKQIGPSSSVEIPDGMPVYSAAVVTPGLIDAHSVVGLTGYLNQSEDQDQLDLTSPLQPELRAIDAYNPQDRLVEWVRQFGVTTLHTGHAPGATITGQTMIVKTRGDTVRDAVLRERAMIATTLGAGAIKKNGAQVGTEASPGTRSKVVAILRNELVRAQEYNRKRRLKEEDKRPQRDLHLEALVDVLDRKIPLLVTAHESHDIMTALRVAREFNIKIVLDGCAEAYMVLEDLKQASVPIIIHPTLYRASGETKNLSMETATVLQQAEIPFAMQSGFETYVPKTRVVLFEAAAAVAQGLSFEEALASITLAPARILEIEDRVGSLEVGKDGDMVLFDGDPFEYTTHVTTVIIEGEVVSNQAR